MKKFFIVAFTLLSMSTFAADKSFPDIVNMGNADIDKLVANMSKSEFIALYRHYNQAILDDWNNGAKGEDKVSPKLCRARLELSWAGDYNRKFTHEEELAIDEEHPKSVLRLCMKNIF